MKAFKSLLFELLSLFRPEKARNGPHGPISPLSDIPPTGGDDPGQEPVIWPQAHPSPDPPLSDLEASDLTSLMADSLHVAVTQLKVREDPPNSNRGPEVDGYLASVGRSPGDPWCAAFVFWCIEQAWGNIVDGGPETPDERYIPPFPQTAYTPGIWTWAKGQGKKCYLTPEDVKSGAADVPAGALFLLFGRVRGEKRERVKHVGFVEQYNPVDGVICTVEGNTNPGGSREGGGVYRLEREIGEIYRFVLYGI